MNIHHRKIPSHRNYVFVILPRSRIEVDTALSNSYTVSSIKRFILLEDEFTGPYWEQERMSTNADHFQSGITLWTYCTCYYSGDGI